MKCVCVSFSVQLAECKRRVRARAGHPSGLSGDLGVALAQSLHGALVPAAAGEGFEEVVAVPANQPAATRRALECMQASRLGTRPPGLGTLTGRGYALTGG